LKAWDRVRRVFQDLPRWIEQLEVPGGVDDDEEGLLALEHARKLRTLLFDAETQTEHFHSVLEMLEKWSTLAIAEDEVVSRSSSSNSSSSSSSNSNSNSSSCDRVDGFEQEHSLVEAQCE
jgi:hypothetical protein